MTGRTRLLLAAVCTCLLAGPFSRAGAEERVGWMIYPYVCDERLSAEEFQALLDCEEATYAGFQISCNGDYRKPVIRERFETLRKAGRRIILQIWYGAGRPFSWERYNYPSVALDPAIRREFYARVTDPLLDFLGAENLHAVHIMEETGMQFGWDVDIPARPDRDDDGLDSGNNFDNPSNFLWNRGISGPEVLTIRRYNDRFREETGLDMRYYPIWSDAEMRTYRRWVQTTMEAGMHCRFAEHVHERYPGLHVYAFNGGPALIPQSRILDGQFFDPYTATAGVYASFRESRLVMRPGMEMIAMVWGNREKPAEQRMPQMAAAYAAGSTVLSTFGDKELRDAEWRNVVRDSVRPFLGLPVFQSSPKVLILGGEGWGASLRNTHYWTTGFCHYERWSRRIGATYDLSRYDLLLCWGVWHEGIRDWIRNGGVFVGVHPENEFPVAEGFLEPKERRGRKTIDYTPNEWMRENLRLRDSYALELDLVQEYLVKQPDAVHRDEFLYVFPYGKGWVVWLPAIAWVHPPWQYEPHWEVYRQLLADVGRGALLLAGKQETAAACIGRPDQGNDYIHAVSDDGRTTVAFLLNDIHGGQPSPTSFVISGLDRVSGERDARLCAEHPVVVVHTGEDGR